MNDKVVMMQRAGGRHRHCSESNLSFEQSGFRNEGESQSLRVFALHGEARHLFSPFLFPSPLSPTNGKIAKTGLVQVKATFEQEFIIRLDSAPKRF